MGTDVQVTEVHVIGRQEADTAARKVFSSMRVTPEWDTVVMLVMDRRSLVTDEHSDESWGMTSGQWQPLSGDALLQRLRVTGRPRPAADPATARLLRHLLEEGLEDGPGSGSEGGSARGSGTSAGGPTSRRLPIVVTKDRLTRVLSCEAHQVTSEFGERPPTQAIAVGALVDCLFRQLVTIGHIEDPMADGIAALSVDDHQSVLVDWIERLPSPQRVELSAEVERQVLGLVARWPVLSPGWLPRTQEPLKASLADGHVLLSARIDLAIGQQAVENASIGIVELKSGRRRGEHRADLHFYALIEALRSPAPPFMVATYYSRTGELDVEPVSEELLLAAARRARAGIDALRRLADGAEPVRTPNPLCSWCEALPACAPGQRRARSGGPGGPGGTTESGGEKAA